MIVDYRKLRWHNRNSEQFRHLKLLLYWPVYGILFLLLETVWTPKRYFNMYCPIDDLIPFCEAFVIPYLFWFVYLIGIHIYTLLYDVPAFKKFMQYNILAWSAALVIFFLFPNCQTLRVANFERSNALTDLVAFMYWFDSNTNVCPSLHVIGTMGVHFAAKDTRLYQDGCWNIFFRFVTPLVCFSTVFLKQHSILDVIAGYAVSGLVYQIIYVWGADHRAYWKRTISRGKDCIGTPISRIHKRSKSRFCH